MSELNVQDVLEFLNGKDKEFLTEYALDCIDCLSLHMTDIDSMTCGKISYNALCTSALCYITTFMGFNGTLDKKKYDLAKSLYEELEKEIEDYEPYQNKCKTFADLEVREAFEDIWGGLIKALPNSLADDIVLDFVSLAATIFTYQGQLSEKEIEYLYVIKNFGER